MASVHRVYLCRALSHRDIRNIRVFGTHNAHVTASEMSPWCHTWNVIRILYLWIYGCGYNSLFYFILLCDWNWSFLKYLNSYWGMRCIQAAIWPFMRVSHNISKCCYNRITLATSRRPRQHIAMYKAITNTSIVHPFLLHKKSRDRLMDIKKKEIEQCHTQTAFQIIKTTTPSSWWQPAQQQPAVPQFNGNSKWMKKP